MALSKLQFRPGVNRESTSYANEGGWYDIDKVRFRFGFPEKIGGWVRAYTASFLGTCRALWPWEALSHTPYMGIGTHKKYYVSSAAAFGDVTPIRRTGAAGTVTFTAFYSTLSADVTDTADTLPIVAATTGMPPQGYVRIGSETIFYGSLGANSLQQCTRGADGTAAAAHVSTSAVDFSTMKVSDVGHGATAGSFVTFSGATNMGGNASAARLNQEYEIAARNDDNSYFIHLREVGTLSTITVDGELVPTLIFATSAATGSGGANAYGAYQINIGYDMGTAGIGWGTGPWGRSTWGSAWESAQPRLWSHDNYGEDLLLCVRDGVNGVYYWDTSVGIGTRAAPLSALPGANTTPTIAKQILLSDRDRHIVVFGCDDEFSPGVQDPLLIRWSDTESRIEWASSIENSAGSLRLGMGTEIVCAIETKQEILVFTDVSLHSMQFVGAPYTFGINMIAAATSIMAPNVAVVTDDAVFWMGNRQFFFYTGTVQELPCTVLDYVFNNFNYAQRYKAFACNNKAFSEVWWFYPSASSDEVDRYVVYNYQQAIWYYGALSRTAWVDRGARQFPTAAAMDGHLYSHELGTDDGSTDPVSPITAYIESSMSGIDYSSAQTLSDFVFISRVIPDVTFLNSTADIPTLELTVKVSNFPGGLDMQEDANTVTKTESFSVVQYTNQLWTRLRGRAFAFRVESSDVGVTWRLGVPRLDLRSDGRR